MKGAVGFRDAAIFMNRDALSKKHLEEGKTPKDRYENYLEMYRELEQKKRY